MHLRAAFCVVPFNRRRATLPRYASLTCALTSPPKSTSDNVAVPPADDRFSKWAAENKVEMPALALKSFAADAANLQQGLRGMAAVSAVRKGDRLISVAREATLQVTSLDRKQTPLPSSVSQDTWQSLPWFARLALLLLDTKLNSEGKLRVWIERLPESLDVPFHWSDEELAELQNTSLIRDVQDQRKLYRKLFDMVNGNADNAIARSINYGDFVWAIECIRSRAFSGPLEVAPFKERLRLFIFLVGNTFLWPSINVIPWENALNGGLTALFALTVYDIILPRVLRVVQGVELKRFAMTPGIDFLNHSSAVTGKAEVSYEYFTDKFVVQAGEDYEPGDQVFISYGKQSNDSLLQYYGFVENNNPAEMYAFSNEVEGILGVPKGSLIARRRSGFDKSTIDALARKLGQNKDNARTALRELCLAELSGLDTSLEEDIGMLGDRRCNDNARLRLAVRYRIGKKQVLQDALQFISEQ